MFIELFVKPNDDTPDGTATCETLELSDIGIIAPKEKGGCMLWMKSGRHWLHCLESYSDITHQLHKLDLLIRPR